jgi:hypothetical protein
VELEDARDELRTVALRALAEGATTGAGLRERLEIGSRSVEEALRRLADVQARLEHQSSAAGLPVAEAARYLAISEPTVRAWLARRVLAQVAGSKPVLVDLPSLRRVGRALAELRERGQDRDWVRALVDHLHDSVARSDPALGSALEELRHGDLEQA